MRLISALAHQLLSALRTKDIISYRLYSHHHGIECLAPSVCLFVYLCPKRKMAGAGHTPQYSKLGGAIIHGRTSASTNSEVKRSGQTFHTIVINSEALPMWELHIDSVAKDSSLLYVSFQL